jgi:hypothetical protein
MAILAGPFVQPEPGIWSCDVQRVRFFAQAIGVCPKQGTYHVAFLRNLMEI